MNYVASAPIHSFLEVDPGTKKKEHSSPDEQVWNAPAKSESPVASF